jgi:[acyl-carrier-protein] S-malonyltransferase
MSDSVAFVFPGGGSQKATPIDEFRDAWPEIESSVARLDDEETRRLLFRADADALDRLENMHRVVMGAGFAVARAVVERFDVEPDVVAGHSTGHLTALPVAGALAPADALEFVVGRSRAMKASASARGPGRMVAVLLVDSETVASVVDAVDGASVAAFNAPKQTVISGRSAAVDTACERLESDCRPVRTVRLDVELAAHSPVVAEASEWVADATERFGFADPTVPVVSDLTGEVYDRSAVAERDLPEQVVSPVRWTAVVETLAEMGVDRVVEFPPAGVLTDFVSKTEPEMTATALASPDVAETLFDDA